MKFCGAIPVEWTTRAFSNSTSEKALLDTFLATVTFREAVPQAQSAAWCLRQNDNVRKGQMHGLRRAVQTMQLTDLHTHLTGMGSKVFWVETVMEKVLPGLVRESAASPCRTRPKRS